MKKKPIRVLAVSSSGGHWVQLLRLRLAWRNCDVAYLTTAPEYEAVVKSMHQSDSQNEPRFYTVISANRDNIVRLIWQALRILVVIIKERPDVVFSTGAAPGYLAIRFAKYFGARTVWIDSIANVESMSLSGAKAANCADLWLTQWPELAEHERHGGRAPKCWGAVL